MKAVKITQDNRPRLLLDYGFDLLEELPLGWWLIASFGTCQPKRLEGLLREETFDLLYTKVAELNNGWVEIVRTV